MNFPNQSGGVFRHLLQRAGFLEQVGGAGDDDQFLLAAQGSDGLPG